MKVGAGERGSSAWHPVGPRGSLLPVGDARLPPIVGELEAGQASVRPDSAGTTERRRGPPGCVSPVLSFSPGKAPGRRLRRAPGITGPWWHHSCGPPMSTAESQLCQEVGGPQA